MPERVKLGVKVILSIKKLTNNHIPTVAEASKYINSWIEFHNNQPCLNDRIKTIKECLNSVPIISEATYYAVQEKLNTPSKTRQLHTKFPYNECMT